MEDKMILTIRDDDLLEGFELLGSEEGGESFAAGGVGSHIVRWVDGGWVDGGWVDGDRWVKSNRDAELYTKSTARSSGRTRYRTELLPPQCGSEHGSPNRPS